MPKCAEIMRGEERASHWEGWSEGMNCTSGGGMQISVTPDEVIKLYGPNAHIFVPFFYISFLFALREGTLAIKKYIYPALNKRKAINLKIVEV